MISIDFLSLVILGIGLSMDSFALAVSCGLRNVQNKKVLALKIAVIFAIVQATTPIIGWLAGLQFRDFVVAFDHWFAVIVLGIIGGNMIFESYRDSHANAKDPSCEEPTKPLTFLTILWMGVATSIDALAVGVTFAFLDVSILLAVLLIGGCTLLFTFVGFVLGHSLGNVLKSKAEFFGGMVLIGLGIKILIEHVFFNG